MTHRKSMVDTIIANIHDRRFLVGVIGLGYVGLPLAREFLHKNFQVLGFDIDPGKVEMINSGQSYIKHIQDDFIKEFVISKKKFSATTDFSRLKDVDAVIICVPTPLGRHQDPNLSYVLETAAMVVQNLRACQMVILESTTYPGTTEGEMLPLFQKDGHRVGSDFFLGYSPEREDPGNRHHTTSTIPKVVSGVTSECLRIIETLYQQICRTVVPVSSPRVAEASKILENTYRAVNIALVNELKTVFDHMDIDIWEVIEAAKTKPFGFQPFYPGPGLGGHCIPIDPFYLTWKAKEFDLHTRFIELAGEINNHMPYYVVDRIIRALNTIGVALSKSRILLAGLAYKPDVDDMRESPALKILDILANENAKVDYFDPFIPSLPETRKYTFQLTSIDPSGVEDGYYDAVVVVTDHSEIDYQALLRVGKRVIDTRNVMAKHNIKSERIFKS